MEDKLALQNEIDILTQVDHPNIVKLHEIFEDGEAYYLVMELMLGGEVRISNNNNRSIVV
jgi:calcium/calmodulin-dependent protein kinase I